MNTPNKITLSRILLIPLVIFFYLATFIPYGKLIAALIFTIACFTDFLDGMIARKTNQVTDLGKFFDTIADKVLIMTGMILVVAFPVAGSEAVVKPLWLGITCIILMLAREFIISALRQIAASKGIVLAADKGGKLKAMFQDITITLYMFYAFFVTEIYPKTAEVSQGFKTANMIMGITLMVLLLISTVLTITSGISYIVKNKHVFAEGNKNEVVTDKNENTEEIMLENEEVVEENENIETVDKPVEKPKPQVKKKTTSKKTATAKTTAKKTTKNNSNRKTSTAKKSSSQTKKTSTSSKPKTTKNKNAQ